MCPPSNLIEPSAHALAAGDLEAVLLPGAGMLGRRCATGAWRCWARRGSRGRGRQGQHRRGAAAASVGEPPRGSALSCRWRDVALDPGSPLLHFDANGLPIHGVPWSLLAWQTIEARQDRLAARLDWSSSDLLAVFPFPHRLELTATLRPDALTLETILTAGPEGPVPVSFGFHPYFRLPGLRAAQWRLSLPPMRKLVLDRRGIPTGEEQPFAGWTRRWADSTSTMAMRCSTSRPRSRSRAADGGSQWNCSPGTGTHRSSHRRTTTTRHWSR